MWSVEVSTDTKLTSWNDRCKFLVQFLFFSVIHDCCTRILNYINVASTFP
uniref:Uncharacterized protein n=1 Tax=Rhizophora mucronata TaxID=61149 RepID=A0A2P2R2E4_RHIMU